MYASDEMKNYKAPDAFQLIPPPIAAWALIYGVILGMIFAPVMK